jgi:glycine cleavage system H protein
MEEGMGQSDRKFSKDHTWVKLEDDKALIGITDYAQNELGDVVFIEFPDIGRELSQGESFGVIESVKAVSDLHAPIGGAVTEINEELQDAPEIVNSDPLDKGWIIAVDPENYAEQANNLMDEDAYLKYTEEEAK